MIAATAPCLAVDWEWNANALPQHDKEIKRAIEACQRGDFDSAVMIVNQCKGRSPDDCRVRHILVDLYRENKRMHEAKSEMQELIAVEQRLNSVTAAARPAWADVAQAKVELARLYQEDGDYGNAIRMYQEAQSLADVERQKNWSVPRLGMAACYEAQGEWNLARQAYEHALKDQYLSVDMKDQLTDRIASVDKRLAGDGGHSITTEATASRQQQPQPVDGDDGGDGRTGADDFGSGSSGAGSLDSGSAGGVVYAPARTAPARTAPGPSGSAAAQAKSRPVAVQQAIAEMNQKNYEAAAGILKIFLTKNKTNAEAHYLLGVSYAFLNKNAEAALEYEAAINHANSIDLQRMAAAGLKKVRPAR